ncbi:MAG: SDR family NAD(P)-dependent oxidoreductase [Alphaproteobacteria bacterium]|nr:SDR family NAD(P)-dependent oxidoreductase [Alphaproteobacteria bacterium]
MAETKIDLSGHNAIVTGGAAGMGLAMAQRLARSGANVCIWDLDRDAIDRAVAELSANAGNVTVFGEVADISDPSAVDAALTATRKRFDSVEITINNAGIAGPNVVSWEYPIEDWRQVIAVDLVGTFLVSRAVIPLMLEKSYGRIVNIASVAGKEGNPNASAYSAAKAGVIGLTKSLGKELATTGILVNCVTPAAVHTALFDQMTQEHVDYMLSKIPMGRLGLPDEVAAMVTWLCSEECSFSTGAVFDLSGGRATY